MFCESILKEYCTEENKACTANSWRMRTHSAVGVLEEPWAPEPGCRKVGGCSRVERPRSTSKSGPNRGCLGTRAKAEAISFCSSGEGVQTLSRFTLTFGWGGEGGCWPAAKLPRFALIRISSSFRSTQRF